VQAYPHHGFWQAMDTLRDKQQLEELWPRAKPLEVLVDSGKNMRNAATAASRGSHTVECCAWKPSNITCRKAVSLKPGTTSSRTCRSPWRRPAPRTLKPLGPDDLAPLFPMSLILQEVSTEREIEIPGEVRQVYAQWRPSPLFRARRLEQALDTPAHIYYKNEGVSPAGSHKPNTAVPQAFYNKQDGTKRLSTETGAGQWGSALAMACAFFGMECKVFMVRVSYDQKPYRRALMGVFGASVTASPSMETETGRAILAEHPDSNGSLGIAISEAVEIAASDPHTKYALGSVLNHVMLHQTVIGLEAIEQMALADDEPDVILACTGGGSNFAGLTMPYIGRNLKGKSHARIVAVEPAACPSLTKARSHTTSATPAT